MFNAKNTTIVILLAVIVFFVRERRLSLYNSSLRNVIHNNYLPAQHVHEKLKEHSSQFDKAEIIEVTEGVWVAIGYALANSIIIEANNSLIIVDTMESVEAATRVRNDFESITKPSTHNKPFNTIIYTHYHPDHTWGTAAYIDDDGPQPTIISHPKTLENMNRLYSIASSIAHIRGMRQFGPLLHEYDQYQSKHSHSHHHDFRTEQLRNMNDNNNNNNNDELTNNNNNNFINNNRHTNSSSFDEKYQSNVFENSGIGPFLQSGPKWTASLTIPNKLLNDPITKLNIDGIKMELYHAPGETTDQIFVYLTEKRVLLPADNIYRTFPNIYAIRGSPTRNAREWTQSLDLMRSLRPLPEILVPCHTQPVYGENDIFELLTVYRDGISYIHDQTVRWMNRGLTPDQMIPLIHKHMPHRLRDHAYLQEFYGTIDWSIRGIFQSYLGWFSGEAADLFPLSKTDIGNRMVDLLKNDINYVLNYIQRTLESDLSGEETVDRNSCQWALKLSTELLHSTKLNQAQKELALDLRVAALQCMASFMTSANGRNYYLTSALEDITNSKISAYDKLKEFSIYNMPMDSVMANLRVRLKVELVPVDKRNMTICHNFNHLWYLLEIRDGIMEIYKGELNNNNHSHITQKYKNQAHISRIINKDKCLEADIVTLCTEQVFRDAILQTKTTPALLYASGKFKLIKGKITDMVKFRDAFEKK